MAQYRDSKNFLVELQHDINVLMVIRALLLCHTQGMKHYHAEEDSLSYAWLCGWLLYVVIQGYGLLYVVMGGYKWLWMVI